MANVPTASGGSGSSTDEEVPLDDEAKALKLEQQKAAAQSAIAKHKQEIAEAQKAELAAKLPSTEAVEPLEGKIELGEKTGLIADLLAHSLIRDAAVAISAQVRGKLSADSTVLVVEDRALASVDWFYEAILGQVRQHRNALQEAIALFQPEKRKEEALPKPEALVGPPLAALISAAPAAVNALASVVGMFRSDYAVSGRDVSIGTTPLVSATAGELATTHGVVVSGFQLVEGSAVATAFWEAWGERALLERLKLRATKERIAPTEEAIKHNRQVLESAVAAFGKTLASKDPNASDLENIRQVIEEWSGEIAGLEAAIANDRADVAVADAVLIRFDEFAGAVVKASEGAKYPPLIAAAIQERLRSAADPITHVLYVGLEGAAGEAIRRRNLFLGPRLTYVGGVQVSHLLLHVKMRKVIAAGTQPLLGQVRFKLHEERLGGRHLTWLDDPLPPV